MTSCRKDLAPNTPVFEFCPGSPTVTDVDGNTYNTVLLGDRCWTLTNLKVSKFRNGDALGSDPSLGYWSSVNQGSFTLYNNQAANKNEYGYLYNAYAALDARGLCPLGWHVPTDAEWHQMVKSLDPTANANVTGAESATAGGPLKSTDLWNSPNTGGNNASGFGAVPGGFRSESGVYGAQLDGGTYWSSSLDGSAKTWFRYLYDDNASVVRNSGNMRQGRSIRCIRDLTGTGGGGGGSDTLQAPSITTLTISGITVNQANSGGTISSDGGSPVLQRGVAYGQIPLPDLSQSYTMDGYGSGSFSSQLSNLAANTLYYVRAYATNAVGRSFGQALSFTTSTLPPPRACQANACPSTPTVTDYDGQVYGTVQIGNKCWMASKLRAVSYRNGDAILQ
ncbi:MAG: FISUMP domain-containing protein, partial [Bacteroidota bacterium]